MAVTWNVTRPSRSLVSVRVACIESSECVTENIWLAIWVASQNRKVGYYL